MAPAPAPAPAPAGQQAARFQQESASTTSDNTQQRQTFVTALSPSQQPSGRTPIDQPQRPLIGQTVVNTLNVGGQDYQVPPFSPIRRELETPGLRSADREVVFSHVFGSARPGTFQFNSQEPDSVGVTVGHPHAPQFSTPTRRGIQNRFSASSYQSPGAANSPSSFVGTPSPSRRQGVQLSNAAKDNLRSTGIPEKAILKYNQIIKKTFGNCAVCGSTALAAHIANAQSLGIALEDADLEIGDLDIVYTGGTEILSVAQDVRQEIGSPNTKIHETQGQILLAILETQNESGKEIEFKIDLVRQKAEFATEFVEIDGLTLASLDSLEASYEYTKAHGSSDKAKAAGKKLKIIKQIKDKLATLSLPTAPAKKDDSGTDSDEPSTKKRKPDTGFTAGSKLGFL